ncbi:hypothetical protein CTA2_12949 [Colletotrichum tanaceti]|nr:hypothetical protein CTA2_12949 [Colletotrichum tanaceti]
MPASNSSDCWLALSEDSSLGYLLGGRRVVTGGNHGPRLKLSSGSRRRGQTWFRIRATRMVGVDTTKTRNFCDFRGFEKTATLSQACPGQDSKKSL